MNMRLFVVWSRNIAKLQPWDGMKYLGNITSYKAILLINDAFAQQMAFVENGLKWAHSSIESVKISKIHDGPKLQ